MGWQKGSYIGEDRRAGWVDRMHERGLATMPALGQGRGHDGLRRPRRAALLDRDPAPTAFLCASDTLAMGVLRALDDRGLAAGREIAVVGFDDSIPAQVPRR